MKRVNVVFDGPPSNETGRFVEVEDFETGRSLKVGHWWPQENGLWALTINASPQEEHPATCILHLLPPTRCDCGGWDV